MRITIGLLFFSLLFSITSKARPASTEAGSLQCEYLTAPIGIDKAQPRFSWAILTPERDAGQTGYRIIVAAENPDFSEKNIVWDSGEVPSASSLNIRYEGKELAGQTTYYWKVMLKDRTGRQGAWSATEKFHTGFLPGTGFREGWIMHPDTAVRSPLFRKAFTVEKEIRSAHVYATAIGLYELHLNGQKVDGSLFVPAITQLSERTLYSAYDVTGLVNAGRNALGVWMGEGASAFTEPAGAGLPGGRFANVNMKPSTYRQPMLLLEMKIVYTDGSIAHIHSGEDWKCSDSPLVFNNFFGGEDYDARLEKSGWDTPGYPDGSWLKPAKGIYKGQTSFQALPPVQEGKALEPVTALRRNAQTFEYDFGKTIGGYWEIEVEGNAGAHVIIRGTEKCGSARHQKPLTAENELNWEGAHHKRPFYRNTYSKYVLSGKGRETYKPRFFFHGFRYVQVTVSDPGAVKIRSIKAIETGHFSRPLSEFSTSDPYLGRLHRAITQTFQNNFIQGVPLSNPNSEKYGWTGDVHLYSEIAGYSFLLPALWTKWLNDFRDAQQWAGNSGLIPETVPEMRKVAPRTDFSWTSAYPFLVRQMLGQHLDTSAVHMHYGSLKSWYGYMLKRAEGHILGGTYGDHLIPGFEKQAAYATQGMVRLINTAYLYKISLLMAEMAALLKQDHDAGFYREEAWEVCNAFNERFYDAGKKIYAENASPPNFTYELTANLVALQCGIVPEEKRAEILAFVKEQLLSRGYRAFTGILGTKALVDVLQKEDRELLYKVVLNREFPGWGYFIDHLQASTLNQNWDGGGDFNHCMFGSVHAFLLQDLAGIRLEYAAEVPTVLIDPFIPGNLTHAEGRVCSALGNVSACWKKTGEGIVYHFETPANTRTVFRFEAPPGYNLYIDGQLVIRNNSLIRSPEWLKKAELKTGEKSLTLGSGAYEIKIVRE